MSARRCALAALLAWAPTAGAGDLVLRRLVLKDGDGFLLIAEAVDEHPQFGKVMQRKYRTEGVGVARRLVELELGKKKRSLGGFLKRWQANHGCAARARPELAVFIGGKKQKAVAFGGSCTGGTRFAHAVFVFGDTAYELDVSEPLGQGSSDELWQHLERLLGALAPRG